MKFDVPSFSLILRAGRGITAGEEMSTSYCDPFLSTAERQQHLMHFGFKCTCAACTTTDCESDRFREELPQRQKELEDDLELWLKDLSLPDHYIINHSLPLLEKMEKLNLQATARYESLTETVFVAYAALGDVANTVKYGKMLFPELRERVTKDGFVDVDHLKERITLWNARAKLS